MDIVFVGFTLDVIGKSMVAFTAIMVHHRVLNEHKLDRAVIKVMKEEQKLGILGIILIIVGYILQAPSKF
ncbi:hypothetical protein BK004_03140 [bacterium CG10_46_32]|nr:MAG: hypothetical protein BK004_03140 [bacterium CG10_46_32]PIR55995.1 MAG: hypothetical protein COU73_03180 [Parcubacteria group bacterium CG10_big_fil_rev_8_21_14_0_10_46_32]